MKTREKNENVWTRGKVSAIIGGIGAILIIAIIIAVAVGVGIKLGSKNDLKTTSNSPVDDHEESVQTPTTSMPVEETETPEIEETETPSPNVEVSQMSSDEKKEYAKSIAKKTWEKLGVKTKVYYSSDEIDSEGNYIIAVREEATTKELVRYKINIETGSCEITY